MTDEKIDEPEKALPEYEWASFLTSVPPGSPASLSTADFLRNVHAAPAQLATPELLLHCSSKACRGERIFSSRTEITIVWNSTRHSFLTYSCNNCGGTERTYALLLHLGVFGSDKALAVKIGEWPPFGPPTPPKVISMVGPDRDIFLKGRRSENQGLGIGAFAYYRRVVEEQKHRLLSEILRVARRVGAKPSSIAALESAVQEQQFKKAIDLTKDAIPESLLIDGHNPLTLLHRALSEGLHALSDEECLARARSIRVILSELAERISQALKDTAELKEALSHLLADPARPADTPAKE